MRLLGNDVYKYRVQGMVKALPLHPLRSSSDPRRPRGLLIFPQIQQHLPELLLTRPTGSTFRALAAEIDKLADAFPTRSARGGIFPVHEEVLGLLLGLLDTLFSLLPVVFIEVVYVLLGLFDGFFLFVSGDLFAFGEG